MNSRTRYRILEDCEFRCVYCGKYAAETELEVDHIIPRSKGGSDDDNNLIASCKKCNRGKSNLYETNFTEYKKTLKLTENKEYTTDKMLGIPLVIPPVIPVGDVGKVRLGKDRVGKVSKVKERKEEKEQEQLSKESFAKGNFKVDYGKVKDVSK